MKNIDFEWLNASLNDVDEATGWLSTSLTHHMPDDGTDYGLPKDYEAKVSEALATLKNVVEEYSEKYKAELAKVQNDLGNLAYMAPDSDY